MRLVFWICCLLIAYTYAGYAIWLLVYARLHPRAVRRGPEQPSISVVIALRNEELNLEGKLANLREMRYPAELVQVLMVSDGSTDRTTEILRAHSPFVTALVLESSGGKARALNAAVREATGEILLLLDARQMVEPGAAADLVACFADAAVGAVSGELHLEAAAGGSAGDSVGVYWKIEKMVRKLESASGSVVGVTGAIYAMRRSLWTDIPAGTILDDVFVPMMVARQGKRVVFEPAAVARDRIFAQKGKEFSRKVRTLTGNYQLLQLAPWLLTPGNPLLFRFVCHKLLRLLVPFLLLGMLLSSWLAGGWFYRTAFWAQVLLYGMAALAEGWPGVKRLKPVSIAHTFVMLNVAAAMAFYNFISGRDEVWV